MDHSAEYKTSRVQYLFFINKTALIRIVSLLDRLLFQVIFALTGRSCAVKIMTHYMCQKGSLELCCTAIGLVKKKYCLNGMTVRKKCDEGLSNFLAMPFLFDIKGCFKKMLLLSTA